MKQDDYRDLSEEEAFRYLCAWLAKEEGLSFATYAGRVMAVMAETQLFTSDEDFVESVSAETVTKEEWARLLFIMEIIGEGHNLLQLETKMGKLNWVL